MSTATATAEATFVIEISYEAVTLDYTAPRWEAVTGHEPYFTEEAAEAARLAYNEEHEWFDGMAVTRVRRVKAPRPEGGYVDEFLEAEFAANAAYWRDRAAAADRQKEAEQEMFRCYGRGASVKVVKGRKVPIGTEGEVFWLGDKGWGYSVGFKTSEGEKHFTSISNVESTSPAYEQES